MNVLIDYQKNIEQLKKVKSGEIKEGLKLDIAAIDERIRFKPKNFNVILGHANVGKTTCILYLMLLYTIKHDIKWLVYSSENEAYSLIRKLVEFLEGTPINKIETDFFEDQVAWINDRFKFIDPQLLFTYKGLLKAALDVKKEYDYQGFLIDPYNSLMKDKTEKLNGHEYDYEATSRMRVFCKENDVSIWLNTHANTEALRKRHNNSEEYAGHPIPPLASDVEGGGKFVNRADDFIVIHRYIQHPTDWMYSMIHVRKVKDTDSGGSPTALNMPIRMRSIANNVGFEINGKNCISLPKREQVELKL